MNNIVVAELMWFPYPWVAIQEKKVSKEEKL